MATRCSTGWRASARRASPDSGATLSASPESERSSSSKGPNDIWDSEGKFGGCGQTPRVTADQLIAGYQTLIRAAHARGVRIIGATIIPFKAPYMSPAGYLRAEAIRDQVNHWIRTSGEFDAVADFAKAVADPADPEELNPACNSGDFLHPNDARYRAIAATIKPNEL